MKLTVFGSSSTGNGYALEFDNGKILLLECGTPLKKFIEVFPSRWDDILGCFITHEHGDHCRFAKEYVEAGITLYSMKETLDAIGIKKPGKTHPLTIGIIKDFNKQILIHPFNVVHNASNPLGFMIIDRQTDETLLFITDSAYLEYRFVNIDYIMIECNNIEEIANQNNLNGRKATSLYHMHLDTTKRFLKLCDLNKTKEIILIHLSDSNSNEARMVREINEQTSIKTSAALPGQVYELRKDPF